MKWVIGILLVGGVAGIFAAITGVESARYSSYSGHSITYHGIGGRLFALAVGIGLLVTAWGCWRRRMFAWYTIASLLWVSLVWAAFRAVYLTFTIDLPIAAIMLGSTGEALKIAFICWLIYKLWPKYRAEFEAPIPESSVSRSRHMTPVEQAPGRE
jgi:glucose dehydrogenase